MGFFFRWVVLSVPGLTQGWSRMEYGMVAVFSQAPGIGEVSNADFLTEGCSGSWYHARVVPQPQKLGLLEEAPLIGILQGRGRVPKNFA